MNKKEELINHLRKLDFTITLHHKSSDSKEGELFGVQYFDELANNIDGLLQEIPKELFIETLIEFSKEIIENACSYGKGTSR